MNPLTAYALGILTTCAVSLVGLGLMAYIDYREGQKRLIERRGPTPPEPPTDVNDIPVPSEMDVLNARRQSLGTSTHIKPMSVREAEEAERERNIMWLLENYPLDRPRHLFPVDAPTAQILHMPINAGPDAA